MKKKLSHYAVNFKVPDAEVAAEWYREKLGFEIIFKWGEPVNYVVTNREEVVSIHFVTSEKDPIQKQSIYVFCFVVDEVYEELKEKEIEKMSPIADQDYGMRDFDVFDPYGNQITFGTGL